MHSVSLFSGVGGLDYGLEQAGFDMVFATDVCPDAVADYKANMLAHQPRPGRLSYEGCRFAAKDVRELGAADLAGLGDVALLSGGPPCQSFSSAGRQGGLDDPRGNLFREFARIAALLRPRAVLFENVRGLVTARGRSGRPGEVLDEVVEAFESLGYGINVALLNAADYGLPQRRVRFFLMGVLGGAAPDFPAPTHGRDGRPSPWVPLSSILVPEQMLIRLDSGRGAGRRRVFSEAAYANEHQQAQLELVDVGKGVRSPGRSEPTRPGGHWGYRQGMFVADPDLPARTITASQSQDWVRLPDGRHRRLTPRECLLAQGFPARYDVNWSRVAGLRQIGNAVPPVFGKVLGDVLLGVLRGVAPGGQISRGFPAYITKAIAYTERDHIRNGEARPRFRKRGA